MRDHIKREQRSKDQRRIVGEMYEAWRTDDSSYICPSKTSSVLLQFLSSIQTEENRL